MVSSLLLRPKRIVGKIRAKDLGYIAPDGTINFRSVKKANAYAKSVVVDALNQNHPFERAVLIEGTRIIKQIDGNSREVRLYLDSSTILCDTLVHGHPDMLGKGVTGTFSEEDVRTLFYNPYDMIRTIKIYNSAGEVSTMKKLGVPIGRTRGFSNESLNIIQAEHEKALKIIDESSNKSSNIRVKILKKLAANNIFLSRFIKDLSNENLVNDMATKILIYANHIEMKNVARNLKLSYKTNFSNFTTRIMRQFKDCID